MLCFVLFNEDEDMHLCHKSFHSYENIFFLKLAFNPRLHLLNNMGSYQILKSSAHLGSNISLPTLKGTIEKETNVKSQ